MFTQRKTNSYDLIGTNARNSDASMQSHEQKHYGENMIGRMSLEQFDQEISYQLEQLFRPAIFPLLITRKNQDTHPQDDIFT